MASKLKQSGLDGGKTTERGQELMKAVGMTGKMARQAHSPQNKALQANTAGGLSARLRPHRNKRPTVGRPRSKNTAADIVLPLAVQVSGGSAVVLRKAGADLPILSLPHLSPLPVTVPTHSLNLSKPNLAPN